MITFETAIQRAYDVISKFENVNQLKDAEISKLPSHFHNKVVWKVQTQITVEYAFKEVTFLIKFNSDFPFKLPDIYLADESFNDFYLKAHVNDERTVCTFDSNTTKTKPESPEVIVYNVLERAKLNLENTDTKIQNEAFEDEFSAYWNCTYHEDDNIIFYLSLLPLTEVDGELKAIIINVNDLKFNLVIHNNDYNSEVFKKNLNDWQYSFHEISCFYLGVINYNISPSYELNNKQLIDLIQALCPTKLIPFKKYLNTSNSPWIIVFGKKLEKHISYFGFQINHLPELNKGFRSTTVTSYFKLSYFKNKMLTRLAPVSINHNRLEYRTSGVINMDTIGLKLAFVGLGSVGSNLLNLSTNLEITKFLLVDPEILEISNIKRHFLGYSDTNIYKAIALTNFLRHQNPINNVDYEIESINKLLQNKIEILEEFDFLIISIGDDNIEKNIAAYHKASIIKNSLLFIWVEPYLAGGHIIYLGDNVNSNYDDFFENSLFKFNIINEQEYNNQNPLLYKREAGCQTSYTPYSSADLILFISSIFPEINKILTDKPTDNFSITWVNNKIKIENLEITISNYGKEIESFSVNINKI